jgi:hypothetical protein
MDKGSAERKIASANKAYASSAEENPVCVFLLLKASFMRMALGAFLLEDLTLALRLHSCFPRMP